MWWSKQAQPATVSFSPAFSATRIIGSPIEASTSQPANTIPNRSVNTRPDRLPNREAAPSDDLHLNSIIQGSISLTCKRLTIGETAKATADVVACEVIVYGELTGHLCATDRIEIKKHASVTGDLTTRRILIEEGAYFKGTVQIERRKKPRDASQQRIATS
jgi:cytoskeletal protein CcmA (bactofilin family)